MTYVTSKHESLIFEKIVESACIMIPELVQRVKSKTHFPTVNPLMDYLEKRKIKKEPSSQEILHHLINCELGDEHLLYTANTPYSKVDIFDLNDTRDGRPAGRFNVFIMEFREFDALPGSKPLRYAVLCKWNLAVAVNVNFTRNTPETINTANFILCEILQVASELDIVTESFTTITAAK